MALTGKHANDAQAQSLLDHSLLLGPLLLTGN